MDPVWRLELVNCSLLWLCKRKKREIFILRARGVSSSKSNYFWRLNLEKYIKVLRLLEERNWEEMKEWLHEDFMYIKETALSDRLEHVETLKKQFTEKAAINEPELLHEDEDMMAFKHLVIQKNGKKHRVTQIQLYKDSKVWREISNAIDTG